MIRRPTGTKTGWSSAASGVYKGPQIFSLGKTVNWTQFYTIGKFTFNTFVLAITGLAFFHNFGPNKTVQYLACRLYLEKKII